MTTSTPTTPPCFLVSDNENASERTPEYLAYLAEREADEDRRRHRAGKTPPMDWGTKLDDHHYFCVPCWFAGFEDGAHSYEHGPCELAPRGPFDPR